MPSSTSVVFFFVCNLFSCLEFRLTGLSQNPYQVRLLKG